MSSQKNIIIKTVKKKVAGGHHGGSWKVAYADFVTGMMAFFLLMWLLTMAAPEKRARLSSYFRNFSIFDKSGTSFMEKKEAILSESGGEITVPREHFGEGGKRMTPEQLKEILMSDTRKKLQGLEDQVLVEVFEGGVRIQIVDKAGQPIFPLGGSVPTEVGRKMMEAVAGSIKDVPNRIAIEGHTDALSYSSGKYTNWELSTDRASAARKEMETFGLNPDSIALVAGYAATVPLIRE
ncbi:MAG: flagellar motor protein MotB, partial [Thermodesulfobacteriota bacterium]